MNPLCLLIGHRWDKINEGVLRCERCRKIETTRAYKPVSTLDEIVHDRDWYKPKAKPRHTKD
jgi:hypothetical protein